MSKLAVEIDVPDVLSSDEMKEKFSAAASRVILEQTVLRLYQDGEISTGTGARMLSLNIKDFIQFLGKHNVSIFQYEEGELEDELDRERKRQ